MIKKSLKNRQAWIYTVVVLVNVALALGLSTHFFMSYGIRLDEAQSLWQTAHSLPRLLEIIAEDVHVPLYHVVLHYWQILWGNSVVSARFFSLIFFVLSIPLTYNLGKNLYSKNVGIFAVIVLAVSPFLNWYASEARMYSLLMFLTLLQVNAFVEIFRKNTRISWYVYLLSTILGLYTHYFFVMSILAQIIFWWIYCKQFPKNFRVNMFLTMTAVFLAFIPWPAYVLSLGSSSNTKPSLIPPSSIDFFNIFSQFLIGFQSDVANSIFLSLWPFLVIMLFAGLRKRRSETYASTLLVLYAFLPVVVAFGASLVFVPVFLSRYLILSAPFLYLLIGHIFESYFPKIQILLKGAFFVVMIVGLVGQIRSQNIQVKENFKDVALYVQDQANARDVVILSAPFIVYPFEYYYRGEADLQTFPIWNRNVLGTIPEFSPDQMAESVDQLTDASEKMYVVLAYDQGYEEIFRRYLDENFERLEQKEFSPGINLYVYRLRYDVW
jgi:uncharacterized membrane protein